MAEEGGAQSTRSVRWGIYDRLKKVPPFSSPKSARVVVSPRTRNMDSTEKAAETAARRMVEDHFKQENDSADPMADFALIDCNENFQRGNREQDGEDSAVCECVTLDGDGDKPPSCPFGDGCKNPKFRRYQDAKTKLVKTSNRGWGIAADEDLKPGDFVLEYCGEVVPTKEAIFRSKVYEASGLKDSYIISLNGAEFLDATRKGSLARFVNHSCEPNCEMKKLSGFGEERIGLFASVDIPAGTEVTYDYAKSRCDVRGSVRCACGARSCVGTLGANAKSLSQRDVYAWEFDAVGLEADDAQISADEDDAPLSSFIKGIIPKKLKGVPSTKGRRIVNSILGLDNATGVSATSTVREAPQGAKSVPSTGISESPSKVSENSTAVRRIRTGTSRRRDGSPKSASAVGKAKETPPEARLRRGIPKLPVKLNILEEEEINVAKKRARSEAEAQGEEKTPSVSVDQLLSDNLSRVATFKRARHTVNKLLEEEASSCFPVSEAAVAEVEFAQELDMAAVSDFKTVCEIIHPAMKEFQKKGPEALSFAVSQKWMEAHYKKLSSSLDFHFSIVRHLAGPTFALSLSEESTP